MRNPVPSDLEIVVPGTLRQEPHTLIALEELPRGDAVEPEGVGWCVLEQQLSDDGRRLLSGPKIPILLELADGLRVELFREIAGANLAGDMESRSDGNGRRHRLLDGVLRP